MNWEHACGSLLCGFCGERIRSGDPVLLVTERRSPRCVDCAKARWQTEPPDSLEPVALATKPVQPLVFRTPAKFARDFKVAQSGER